MITELKMYGVACDNCGTQWVDEDNGFVAFTDKSSISEYLSEDGEWHTDNEGNGPTKHYCPKCFGGFDDDDKLIINPQTSQDAGNK